MRYMAQPLSFRWDEGFVARIDEARGLVPRSAFVRRAVEQALGTLSESGDSVTLRATYTASQLDDLAARRVSEISPARSTAQVKRGVQPRPKGGK
jgi:hypothetical protein